MKIIALWSRDHKYLARVLIGFCHITIFVLAFYVGLSLQKNEIFIPHSILWVSTAFFIFISIVFSKLYKSFLFTRRKILDGAILFCSFIMVVSFANEKNIADITSFGTTKGSFEEIKPGDKGHKPSLRELRKQYKEFKKAIKEGRASAGGVLLAILTAAFLGTLVASASCSLACNGHDALAVIVLIGGIAGIFFVCSLIIKGTRRRQLDSLKLSNPKKEQQALAN